MRKKIGDLLCGAVSLLLIAGCVPLPPERPGAAQTLVAPVAPTPTIVATPGTPVAQPTIDVVRIHPPSTRTGIGEVDRVIDAVLTGDASSVRGLMQVLATPCTVREGLGGPPKCGPGEIEGTTVQAFPVGGPEGTFVRPGEIDRLLPLPISGLYAVYRVPADAYREDYWPAGDYGVVFLRPDQSFLIALVTTDGIVRLDYPAGRLPADLFRPAGAEMVLPPAGL